MSDGNPLRRLLADARRYPIGIIAHSSNHGATDDRDNQKHQFLVGQGRQAITLVAVDAALVTATTPLLLLARLVPGLLRCNADGEAKADVGARLLCQIASIDALTSFAWVYTSLGGSHVIEHILGPFGVVHEATNAILLPAVCKFNVHRSADAASRQYENNTKHTLRYPTLNPP
ncbi:hypothetical protein K438DRAFT_1999967 [Mycena galopus ATCC 62051]|nr:hypothetical protein K438DRAFT_1999967 [Mycena galopus ATCC 62051]